MSGFSVCGKLKRDTNLKDVPVIIMSTDATEETFEQHRRLRTHAEVYLKKPISFAELSKHLELYLGSPAGDNGSPSSEILIDDEVDFVETEIEVDSQSDPLGNSMAGADGNDASDAAAFAEQALGALLDDEHAENTIAAPPPSNPPPGAGGAQAFAEVESLRQQLAIANAELDKARSRLSVLERASSELEKATAKIHDLEHAAPDADRLSELQAQISQLTFRAEQAEAQAREAENKLRSAPKSEELQRLQKDLDDTRAKGGATARDFLELREQINRKDKEMLELRDQVTSRDKELLNLRDANLAQERAAADLNDRMAEMDKQLHDLQRSAEAAKADKEQAAKRADDYKKKSDKLAQDLETATQERKADKQRHEEERAFLQAQEAAAHTEHKQALERLQAEQASLVAAAVEQAKQLTISELGELHAKVLAEKDAELANTQSEAVAALARAEQQQQVDIERIREEAEALKVAALATREAELRQEHDNTLAALHRANEAQLEQQRAERNAAEEQLNEQLAVRKAAEDALTRDLNELKAQYDALKATSDTTASALTQLRESLHSALTQLDAIGKHQN
jgi:chromosome segregation ATPase